jgi:predicted AlkP superfamily phosphohydrolase/phosphomutase
VSRTGRLTAAILVASLVVAWCAVGPAGCADDERRGRVPDHRVLVLGIDGMDPGLLRGLIEAGRMPNMSRLASAGTFLPLATSAPPQSPVAWSNFICGADAGTHQIFDFIHRDPHPEDGEPTVVPYLSTSRVAPPARDWAVRIGSWRLPLFGAKPESLRRGGAFWDDLAERGVATEIWRAPANYPPPSVDGSGPFRCLCGMGTPDLLGTYGEFTFFAADVPVAGRVVAGGRFERLRMRDHRGTATLTGPENFLRQPAEDGRVEPLALDFDVVRDPERDVAKIAIGDRLVVLNAGEWSAWVPVSFATGLPGSGVLGAAGLPTRVDAMVRLYLKQVHPTVELYASPLNIDPLRQVNAIATPGDFAEDVAAACGRFYTTGIPEDTKALRAGALDEDDFLAQVELLKTERIRQYRHALGGFERGFLFFYFGHVDQLSHVFWRDRDPAHPAHDPFEASRYGATIEDQYVEMDGLVGEAVAALDAGDTLIVMSDHGFASFRRGFHLNAWLVENGYQAMISGQTGRTPYLTGIDWSRTRAYALGLNALYVNLIDRERQGIVAPEARDDLLEEIARGLLAATDDDGSPIVDTVYRVDRTYPGRDGTVAPDLIVGYADGYRASWATAEGGTPRRLLEDNFDRWSGDHCIAHELVPGILVTNRRVVVADPDLTDLAPTILREFDVEPPPVMTGRPLFARHPAPTDRP